MIVNSSHLLALAPIIDMVEGKMVGMGGTSFGLSEAGYDIRIKQTVRFTRFDSGKKLTLVQEPSSQFSQHYGSHFALASAMEEFAMPDNLVGIVHDKSTWARRGLSVFNTVIESGWKGFLTLELVYHGDSELVIPAGAGIAQVVFHQTSCQATYAGKYQNQPDRPVEAINSK